MNVVEAQTHPVRDKIKDALVAISLANLCFGHAWYYLLGNSMFGYYARYSLSAQHLIALMANIALFAFLFWCGALLVRRSTDWRIHFIGDIALCAALLAGLDFVRLHLFYHFYITWIWPVLRQGWIAAIIVAVSLAAVLLWHRLLARAAKAVIVLCLPLAVFTLTKSAFMLMAVEWVPHTVESPAAPPMFQTIPPRRVVWIIFDEMDQRVAFRQRPTDLQLPELDRLRRESFVANNAYPPNSGTQLSMPSLTTGRPVVDATIASSDDLMLTLANGQQVGWSRLPNVFSGAREMGFNTALVGWHHPYSRVFGPSLNDCEWYSNPTYSKTRAPTFLGSMRLQIRAMFPKLRTNFVKLYRSSLQRSRPLAADPRLGLILLHLFPPHAPGIYNRNTNELTIWGSREAGGYLDNLALADRTLGELRRAMEASGVWTNTWVLISADHWWRESARLDGKLDHRVPYILKPAGAPEGMVYSTPFNTIITHDLLLAILRGDIHNAQELRLWMDQHKTAPPAEYTEQAGDDISL